MLSNIPKTETDKLKTSDGRREHLAECRQRALDVMTEVSDAVADDRLEDEELANEVVSLAQVVHGLVVLIECDEREREAARRADAAASVEIQANLQRCRELLAKGKPTE